MTSSKNAIIFKDEASSALSEIEKKYNLLESDEEWMEKLNGKKIFNINILIELIKKFDSNQILEKDFINSLQKIPNIDSESAKRIFIDVKNTIIPLLENVPEEELGKKSYEFTPEPVKEEKQIILQKLKQPIGVEKALSMPQKQILAISQEPMQNPEQKFKIPAKPEKVLRKPRKTDEQKIEVNKKSDKSDTYRESIE